jgi:hypothetical protein
MTDQHPITPPPELVEQWMHEASGLPPGPDARVIATQAARWGADQELEEFCKLLYRHLPGYEHEAVDRVRAARRPKPPSLKEQSIALLDKIQGKKQAWQLEELDVIRRALEQFND